MIRLLTLTWWKYILAPISKYQRDYTSDWRLINWLKIVICRACNHKCGVHWYTNYGYEPDMHCKNCGEDLG